MKLLKLFALITALCCCAACETTPQIDAGFGNASMALKAQQTRDPMASVRNEGRLVDGLEGQAASNAVDLYYKTFTKPPPPMTIFNMGVVGGAASQ
ncbi:MAG: hypothetical protein E6R09_11455 [Rhodocyclaceae bacterium]|jgi:hypothetical protein|nr:MAG: hypothetical protein E6R09_11455 [Rhodocyclaceae bacterium]